MLEPSTILAAPVAEVEISSWIVAASQRAWWTHTRWEDRMDRFEGALGSVRDALRRRDYRGAIRKAADMPTGAFSSEQLSLFLDALLAAAGGLSDCSEDELEAYDLVISAGDRSPAGDIFETATQLKIHSALFNKGVVLAQLGRAEEAIEVYDELVRRSGGTAGGSLAESAVRALFNKGASLAEMDRREEAIAVYDELVRRFADAEEASVRVAVGKALINKGIALAELNRLAEAIAVLDEVVSRWSDSPDPSLRERAARALLNKASALAHLRHREMALKTYDELLARFGKDHDPTVQEHVDLARETLHVLRQSLN